jgi:thiamine-monophosphate kinase
VAAVAAATGREAFELAAAGGEDYELLACIPPDRMEVARAAVEATGVALTAIGEVAPGAGIALRAADGRVVDVRGFEHGAP